MVIRVTICGGGNGAHVMAGLAAMNPEVEPHVFTLYAGEADTWAENMLQQEGFQVCLMGLHTICLTGPHTII